MTDRKKIPLKRVEAPKIGHVLKAPPALPFSNHTVDFTCAHCGVVLAHAEENQVFNVLIQCAECGCYNRLG